MAPFVPWHSTCPTVNYPLPPPHVERWRIRKRTGKEDGKPDNAGAGGERRASLCIPGRDVRVKPMV
jgi:hypothetical protein